MIAYDPIIIKRLPRLLTDTRHEEVAAFVGRAVGEDYYVEDVLPAVNECSDSRNHFFISNRQVSRLMVKAQRRGLMLLGIIHTHPDEVPPSPSQADVTNCQYAVNAVFQPSRGQLTFFDSSGVIFTRFIDTTPVRVFVPRFSGA
jgi:proteasome lid subunit RPN8/RPN11